MWQILFVVPLPYVYETASSNGWIMRETSKAFKPGQSLLVAESLPRLLLLVDYVRLLQPRDTIEKDMGCERHLVNAIT